MNKQDLYALCTLIPPMDGFNECVQMLKDNLKNVKEEAED